MLCLMCTQITFPEQSSRCYICNRLTNQSTICAFCRSRSRLRRVWWLAEYEGTVKALIYAMKFERKRAYARAFGELLAEALPYVPETTLVVPVPTASKRIRQRGFDQAVILAESFAHARGLPCARLLRRITQVDQIGKRRVERIKQMKGSLQVLVPEKVAGRTILLLDDVLTTGATLETAAKVLRQAGATHVDAAVVARHLLS